MSPTYYDFTVPLPASGPVSSVASATSSTVSCGASRQLWLWDFNVNGEVRHPSQLYEAFFEGLVLFSVIWWFTSRPRPRLAPTGLFPSLSTASRASWWSSCGCRMSTSAIPAGGWFTEGQLLSAPMIKGVALLVWAYRVRTPSGNFAVAQ